MKEQNSKRSRRIGDNLKCLRVAHGYSQEQLCNVLKSNSCDILRSTYSKYEHGELNIKISVIIALKELYNCPYDDFFYGLNDSSTGQVNPSGLEQKLRRDLRMGDNLKRLRLRHNYSQEKLCAVLQRCSCDIGRSTYSKYENGELNIRASVIIALKKLYVCSFDEFFLCLKAEDAD